MFCFLCKVQLQKWYTCLYLNNSESRGIPAGVSPKDGTSREEDL